MLLEEKLSAFLQLPVEFIRKIANSASYRYKEYKIPKKHGNYRKIYHPSKQLKSIQRCLLYLIIDEWPVDKSVYSYRKGVNISNHAKIHVKSNFLLRMDIKDFFPSIKSEDIKKYIEDNKILFDSGQEEDIRLFCDFVCRKNCLTIGAPTSPAISNAVCYNMDIKLKHLANENEVTYTRYADDLFFSTRVPNVLKDIEEDVKQIIKKLVYPSKLKINNKKTRHSSKKGRRQVTGIVLGSDEEIYLGRNRKRKIRSLIYNIEKLKYEKRKYLAGMLAYAQDVETNFINDLILKYGLNKIELARNPKDMIEELPTND